MKIREKRIVSIFECILLVTSSIAFAYLLGQGMNSISGINANYDNVNKNEITFIGTILESIGKIIFGKIGLNLNSVSAVRVCADTTGDFVTYCDINGLTRSASCYDTSNPNLKCEGPCPCQVQIESSDLEEGVLTCPVSNSGVICQQFPASQCASNCQDDCIPTDPEYISGCQSGTCFYPDEGTCQVSSPKYECESNNGEWFGEDQYGNLPQCQLGCCVVGDDTAYNTEGVCSAKSAAAGLDMDYRPELNEYDCWALADNLERGACVFETEFENTCRFMTKQECVALIGIASARNKFHLSTLCSNPNANPGGDEPLCEPQVTTGCVDNEDEVYWFDSCGNRENIYDANKVKSYNNGRVLSKSESCNPNEPNIGSGNCGNCNYLLSSICGADTANSVPHLDYICKDLSCIDAEGNRREDGESWCVYNSQTGVDELGEPKDKNSYQRSVDTVGSRHFRMLCDDGEVITRPCEDFRNEVCIEEQVENEGGGTYSSAACVDNPWSSCVGYNLEIDADPNNKDEKAEYERQKEERNEKCQENPFCLLKIVDIDSKFKFEVCTPRYPPGFDINNEGSMSSAESICGLGTQTCQGVKGDENVNTDCLSEEFTQKMNDLCVSLGDCGTSANYQGEITQNHIISKGKNPDKQKEATEKKKFILEEGYLLTLKNYANPLPGQYITAGEIAEYLQKALKKESSAPGALAESINTELFYTGTLLGMAGLTVKIGLGFVGLALQTSMPSIAAGLNIFVVAATAYAVFLFLFSILGGSELPLEAAIPLLVAGAVGAVVFAAGSVAVIGGKLAFSLCATGSLCIIGILILLITIIVTALLKIFGVGESKPFAVTYQCNPWQPPKGGDECETCGSDGLPCSKYACQSLGRTCEFVNEGTSDEACIEVSPNDVSAPKISPLESALKDDWEYDEDFNGRGYKLVSPREDGCVKENEEISFGVELSERGRCKVSDEREFEFEDTTVPYFGSSAFLREHPVETLVPSLGSIGISNIDPDIRADINFYLKCEDKSGNVNPTEYNIRFCIRPGDDVAEPAVTGHIPLKKDVASNLESISPTIFTSEPAECKWSLNDKSYFAMENEFVCLTGINDRTHPLGWSCGSSSMPIGEGNNEFYVRCLDQPWLAGTADEGNRNAMTTSYKIEYERTGGLVIDSITPNDETLFYAVEPATVVIEVHTSGGLDGTAICEYNLIREYLPDAGDVFLESGARTHRMVFNRLFSGPHTVEVRCEDSVGNVAIAEASFEIDLDTGTPIVTRVYEDAGKLVIVTDENAECAYSLNSCSFGFGEVGVTAMSGASIVHSTPFNPSKTYYVKCEDVFNNKPGTSSCSIVVKGGFL